MKGVRWEVCPWGNGTQGGFVEQRILEENLKGGDRRGHGQ